MPRGPQGQKRPADVIGNAVRVMRIATGEEAEDRGPGARTNSGTAGAAARNAKLSGEDRRAIAKKAAAARWGRGE